MKIFFLMYHSGYVRNYRSVIEYMVNEKAYPLHLGIMNFDAMCGEDHIKKFCSSNANLTYAHYPIRHNLWDFPAKLVRFTQNYLRYLHPRYAHAHKLRERAAGPIPRWCRLLIEKVIVGKSKFRIGLLLCLLRKIEACIPHDRIIEQIIAQQRPDVFLVTPVVDLLGRQNDWLKVSLSLKITTILCIASWDNLTNKGLIQLVPNAVIVWNDIQRREACELHDIAYETVKITGAQCYDDWFAQKPSVSKEKFCQQVGLAIDSEFLLYLASSPFIAPQEVEFVRKWIEAIRRASLQQISNIGILVRPHPQNAAQWHRADFSAYHNTSIYPRHGANPITHEARIDFFNSMFYCKAVVGINTSAMIEAGILGKPVYTILAHEFAETQNGTLHFQHLSAGGLLNIAENLQQHLQQLSCLLTGKDHSYEQRQQFITNFVRPHGIDSECTPIFVEAVENVVVDSANAQLRR